MSERLDKIKAKLKGGYTGTNRPVRVASEWPFPPEDVRWLVAEVERLTDLLGHCMMAEHETLGCEKCREAIAILVDEVTD